MTAPLLAVAAPLLGDTVDDDDMLGALELFAQQPDVNYRSQLLQVGDASDPNPDDTTGIDITDQMVRTNSVPTVAHSNTDEVAGKFTFVASQALPWGTMLVQPRLLIRSPGIYANRWQAFPLGVYVVTTPGRDSLDAAGRYDVTAYDRCYLLQGQAGDALSFAAGGTYGVAVRTAFRRSGLLGSTAALSSIATYPSDWVNKTLPAPRNYPLGEGVTYLQVINELLKESGCAPLYADRHGRWQIENLGAPLTDPLQWIWYGGRLTAFGADTDDPLFDPSRKIVQYGQQQYRSDVWNTPNRWRVIQSGLTFTPTHTDGSDGMVVIDNLADGPASQNAQGRVIESVQTVDATGTTELVKQATKIANDSRATAEQLDFTTAPWPAAWQSDLFRYAHPALPDYARRVLADSWQLPLTGAVMTWSTRVQALR